MEKSKIMLINKKNAVSLKDVLIAYVENVGLTEQYELSLIRNNWDEIVGSKFALESKAESLKNGILTVNVQSSVWRLEIFIRREQIIDKINTFTDKDSVKEMVIR